MTQEEIKKEQEEFREDHLIWCPWSINHGMEIGSVPVTIHNKIEIANLNDFIEFLFEHSEHCDHISQSDAWDEFLVYQINKK